jgi:hypothetical protein
MKWKPVVIYTPKNGGIKIMKYDVKFDSKLKAIEQGKKYIRDMSGIKGNFKLEIVPTGI